MKSRTGRMFSIFTRQDLDEFKSVIGLPLPVSNE